MAESYRNMTCRATSPLTVAEHWPGPGRFAVRHYKLALSELSPEERKAERGGVPRQPTMAEMTTDE